MPTADATRGPSVTDRRRALDADRVLGALCWVVVGFAATQLLLMGFGRDQGIYAVVAEGMLAGKMPYRDVWDFKPPGIYFVHATSQLVFGNKSMMAPRWLEVIGLLGMVLAFVRLSREFFGGATAGLLGGAVAALLHAQLDFWHSGQPEVFGGMLTVFALVLTVSTSSRRTLVWAGVGLLFGAAFLLKPHLGGGAIVCGAYLARREAERSGARARGLAAFAVVGIASLVPIGATLGWFALRGAWPALYTTFFEITPEYTAINWHGRTALPMLYEALEDAAVRFSAIVPVGCALAALLPKVHRREREIVFLALGITCIHVTGIAMQAKFFAYHYAATLPLLAFVAGLGLYKAWRRLIRFGVAGAAGFLGILVLLALARQVMQDLPQSFWDRAGMRLRFIGGWGGVDRQTLDRELARVADYDLAADRQVARRVAELSRPGDPVFVWGFEPVIYWLAEREPPTRFIYNVPQRLSLSRDWSQAELFEALEQRPPAVIVVEHGDVFPAVTGDWLDSAQALAEFPDLYRLLLAEYERVDRIQDFDVYRRLP